MFGFCRSAAKSNNKSRFVRIRLNRSLENKANGFYILMSEGNVSSDKQDEFVVEESVLDVLRKEDIDFDEIPFVIAGITKEVDGCFYASSGLLNYKMEKWSELVKKI